MTGNLAYKPTIKWFKMNYSKQLEYENISTINKSTTYNPWKESKYCYWTLSLHCIFVFVIWINVKIVIVSLLPDWDSSLRHDLRF